MALIQGVIGVKDCLCEMKTEVLNMEKMQAFFSTILSWQHKTVHIV